MNRGESTKAGVRGFLAVRWMVLMFAVLLATGASAATSGYTITSTTSVRFYVNDAPWADLHYQVNGGTQLNVRMTASGTNHTYNVTGVPTGATVRYFFTIGSYSGGATDTAWAQFSMSGTNPNPGGSWTVVWEDTFDGSGQPNAANWSYHVGNGWNPGAGAFSGWGNGEWEWYRPENTYVQNGNLVIKAEYHTTPTVIAGRNWYQRSGRITTKGKRSWTHGRIEARIAMPNAIGTWPAFWMMGTACDDTVTTNYAAPMSHYDVMASNWSSCGEIDIMEHKNSETNTYQNLFWDSRIGLYPWANGMNNDQPGNIYVGNVTQFHLYTIEWEPTQIRWYVDRETNPSPVHTVDITASNKEEFQKPFHIILNLALGGQFTGNAEPNLADFPMYMYVDYVRVWQRK
ncbi:glycoside hydrolase family 16 protein [Archangium violaceum]|uniref:glycoside hydrolase family 16 protein n=1 Tax=Archangium violaceum TaxID=83451 RepID=UPI00193B2D1B|nr:glycoside hydrolase family 16 protein [Archangium violaceum]QRK06438.1 glycoside hydrolase family 16 protein [Archangium violaceum]